MKLGNLIIALPILQKLASEKLTIRTLYKVKKLMSRLDKELQFYNVERSRIIEELCQKDTETQYIVPEENRESLNKQLQELADVDIEPAIEPVQVPIEEDIRLSYNDLVALEGLIELYDSNEK